MKTINIEKALGHLPVVHVNNTEGVELAQAWQDIELVQHVPDGLIVLLGDIAGGRVAQRKSEHLSPEVWEQYNIFSISRPSEGWQYPHNQDVVSESPDLYYSLDKYEECWNIDNPRDASCIEEHDIGDVIDIYCGEAKTTAISDFLNDIGAMIAENIYERTGEDEYNEKFQCPVLGVELNKKVGECVDEFYKSKGIKLGFREVDNVVKQQYRLVSIEPVELKLIE